MKQKLSYASADNVVINAIIGGLYSFKTKADAQDVLASLREKFILSKQTPADAVDSVILWIKDFAVEVNEKNFAGNFASVFVDKKSAKKWSLAATKIPTELKQHPQRVYEKSQHPNWGFPLLRIIKKGKKFAAAEQAAKSLRLLQEEFPKTSVPAAGKLYIMIYEKADDKPKGGAVNKYVLEIKATPENDGFFIDYYLNETKPKKAETELQPASKKEPQGKFTTAEELRRAKKKRRTPILPQRPTE